MAVAISLVVIVAVFVFTRPASSPAPPAPPVIPTRAAAAPTAAVPPAATGRPPQPREAPAPPPVPAAAPDAPAKVSVPAVPESPREEPTPTPMPVAEPVFYIESTDSPGVSGDGQVPVKGVLVNRGDGPGCAVHLKLRVYYERGGLAASGETTVDRVAAHARIDFVGSVRAPRDLGASAKQARSADMWYERELKPMGQVEASIVSFGKCE